MGFDLIRVLIVGSTTPEWRERIVLSQPLKHEAAGFDIHAVPDDTGIARLLAELSPQVILSLGEAIVEVETERLAEDRWREGGLNARELFRAAPS